MLVSLPTSISPANDKDEALTALQSTVASDNVTVLPFKIPEFKIGTLDALVQQADDLAKLESSCEAVVAKVGDSLRSLLEGDEEKISQQKTVNDSKLHGLCAYAHSSISLSPDLTSQSRPTSTSELSSGTRLNIAPTSHLPN